MFFRKYNALILALSLAAVILSFLSGFQYKREKIILQKKWQPAFDAAIPQGFHVPVINELQRVLDRYDIKVSLSNMHGALEVEFCNKYSWVLDLFNEGRTGFYHKTTNNKKERVSVVSSKYYNEQLIGKESGGYRNPALKKIDVLLACDLPGRTASVYLNNVFFEKIDLGDNDISYFVSMYVSTHIASRNVILRKMTISDNNGKDLFNSNYIPLGLYKIVSNISFCLGTIMLFAYALFRKSSLMQPALLISILILAEIFLRISQADNPSFNINKMRVKWDFERMTNLFGRYNNADTIEIPEPNRLPLTYNTAKGENSVRIACLGSCPLAGIGLSDPASQVFAAVLEKMLNPQGATNNEVINISLAQSTISSAEQNIYLRDVLHRLKPDVIVIYDLWAPSNSEIEMWRVYKKAAGVLEKNSDWIKGSRLLYAALEFKKPIKEIVYLYDFLCNSYLFMGIENFRKNIFNRLPHHEKETFDKQAGSSFSKTLELYRDRNFKMLLIPQFDFVNFKSDLTAKTEMEKISKVYKNVYYLDMQDAFLTNKNLFLGYDLYQPSEQGHRIIAEEIYNKLIKDGMITLN